jgi:hypothetical protein
MFRFLTLCIVLLLWINRTSERPSLDPSASPTVSSNQYTILSTFLYYIDIAYISNSYDIHLTGTPKWLAIRTTKWGSISIPYRSTKCEFQSTHNIPLLDITYNSNSSDIHNDRHLQVSPLLIDQV